MCTVQQISRTWQQDFLPIAISVSKFYSTGFLETGANAVAINDEIDSSDVCGYEFDYLYWHILNLVVNRDHILGC